MIRMIRIIATSDAGLVNYSEVCTTGAADARTNDTGGKTVIKWDAPDNDPGFVPASVAAISAVEYNGRTDHTVEEFVADVESENEFIETDPNA